MVDTRQYNKINDFKRYSNEGYSLAELMITIAIIGILVAAAFVGVPALFERVYVNNTKTLVKNVDMAIKTFKLDTGKYPTLLRELYKNPGIEGWRGPYGGLRDEESLKDGWDRKLVYHLTPEGRHPYELYSYGGSAGPHEPKDKRISAWGR